MIPPFHTLKINGQSYTTNDLAEISRERLNFDLPDWEKDIYRFLLQWLNHHDYIEVRTSGSTGRPKKIRLMKDWMVHSAQTTSMYFGLSSNNKGLLCLPTSHIAGQMMIVRAFVAGLDLLTVEPSANPFEKLKQHVDFVAITPYQLHHGYQSLSKLSEKTSVIVGGADVPADLADKTQNLRPKIYGSYGMTETCSHIALRKINGEGASDFYSVLSDIEISTDERDCLVIEAPLLSKHTLYTNDVVELRNEKEFKWLGRWDNIINSGGIKVSPENLENMLTGYLHRLVVISSLPDERLGEKIVLVTEKNEIDSPANKDKIMEATRRLIKPYQRPKKILVLDTIPKTPTGKPDRRRIKELIR
jgi:O-succinylbenzoic acid--CoA ligase